MKGHPPMSRELLRWLTALTAFTVLLWTGDASADKGAKKKAPAAVGAEAEEDEKGDKALDVDDDVDIGNIVKTATKSKTTIQEAPAVIHVVTSESLPGSKLPEPSLSR